MSAHVRVPAHVTCPLTCMLLMVLLFMPSLSQWAVMSVCDGEKELKEVSSTWFSENGCYAVDKTEAREEIKDDIEEEMEETMVDGPWLNLN